MEIQLPGLRRFSGLRVRLLLLLSVAVLPAIAILLIGRMQEQRANTRELHAQVQNLARLTAQAHAQRVEVARQLLIALANHPAMQGPDLEQCDALVRALTRQYEGIYATIGRADANGAVDCVALDGATAGISIADREYFQRAKNSGTFIAGDFMHGKIRNQPTLAFAYPLRTSAGSVSHVIFANADLTVLSRDLEADTRMEGTTISLLDRNGALIARSADADRFFGVSASASQLAMMREHGEIVTTFWGPDGIRRLFAIATIRDRHDAVVGFATVGVPDANITAALAPGARREWLSLGLLLIGLTVVGWLGSELLIRRPIAKLVKVTGSLAAGDLSVRAQPVGGVLELEGLAAAFNKMASQLQERELHLREGQRLEAVGQLAGGIAHDFNNLLTVIIGYADALAEAAPNGVAEGQLKELRAAAEKAARLTQQLLAFSRRQVLVPTPLKLNDVITDMVTLLRRTTGGDVAIAVDLDPELGVIYMDRVQMEQVILNLVINARDAMPFGGALRIDTRNVTEGGRRQIQLAIADTGTGMDGQTLVRIFEPFFTTKGAKGTGLGLATVYGIIKQSGGDITCDSEPGRGARFQIRLPHHADAAPVVEAPRPSQPVGGSEQILLVDDDDGVRAVLEAALARRGYRVQSSAGAGQALQWFEDGLRPDLVLSDIRMPGMNGLTFVHLLQSYQPAPAIILMSGDAAPALADDGNAASAVFLQKPVTANMLLRAVRELLDARERTGVPVS
jgi:signal transduction histidine kinase/ActR/RegA family two-component response regulator/phage gpG-like protein